MDTAENTRILPRLVDVRVPGWGTPRLCYARELDLRVGYRVVVDTEVGELVGRVSLTPRRREPYMEPYDITRIITQEDEEKEDANRELAREIRKEAEKFARDYRIQKVQFVGCDVSLDGLYVEVKYESEEDSDFTSIERGLEERYNAQVVLRRFTFIERAADTGGCDTCGLPLCCAVWSGARSMGPVNVRLAKQQGVTPNEKVLGSCGEVKCCMRYEHDTYKEFKERAPYKNTHVKLDDREGRVVDYSMVKDSVLVQFGEKRSDQELVPLGRLAEENEDIEPVETIEFEDTEE
ncbi:MAG: regulatory iron-sulfur-containing complex subunit RicT [Rubrobacteraceae bacterium]